MMGFTAVNHDPSTGGFNFTHSKAIRNGMFVGKVFDQRTQSELSEGRAVSSIVRCGSARNQQRVSLTFKLRATRSYSKSGLSNSGTRVSSLPSHPKKLELEPIMSATLCRQIRFTVLMWTVFCSYPVITMKHVQDRNANPN